MRPSIPVFLVCVTLCVSLPLRNTAPFAPRLANRVNTVKLQALDLPVSTRQLGLNFFPCSNSVVCAGGRGCFSISNETQTVTSCSTNCLCVPPDLSTVFCQFQSNCDLGESCITVVGSDGSMVCVDNRVLDGIPPNDTSPIPTPRPSEPAAPTVPPSTTAVQTTAPVTTPPTSTISTSTIATTESATSTATTTEGVEDSSESVASGLTLDPCRSKGDCRGDRMCLNLLEDAECNTDDCRCFPNPISFCNNDSECESGEACFTIGDIPVDLPFLSDEVKEAEACGSRAAIGNLPCIGAHSLTDISREELVFKKDAVAHVLCDLNGSCATPGHIVRYNDRGMMMKSYCGLTGCMRKVMRVNSPRYRKGLTVASKTDGLLFTALAARYESRAEEGVLSTAVRFGF